MLPFFDRSHRETSQSAIFASRTGLILQRRHLMNRFLYIAAVSFSLLMASCGPGPSSDGERMPTTNEVVSEIESSRDDKPPGFWDYEEPDFCEDDFYCKKSCEQRFTVENRRSLEAQCAYQGMCNSGHYLNRLANIEIQQRNRASCLQLSPSEAADFVGDPINCYPNCK